MRRKSPDKRSESNAELTAITDQVVGTGSAIAQVSPVSAVLASTRSPYRPYSLTGPQRDPEAAFWTSGITMMPHAVSLNSVLLLTNNPANAALFIPPYPKNPEYLEWEIAELAYLAKWRDDASAIVGAFEQQAPASALPEEFQNTARAQISDYILLDKVPFEAIHAASGPAYPGSDTDRQHSQRGTTVPENRYAVMTGAHLARMFEYETPGWIHRQALNALFNRRPEFSPPRQALVWMSLEIAIYSASVAAWHYKWAANPTSHARRQRPFEYDAGRSFRVLYDDNYQDADTGDVAEPASPQPSPGTPRSPSYPSEHTATAVAGAEILAFFFPGERDALRALAENIGTARLWAGVNWRSDYAAGGRLGRAVAQRVIEQLKSDCFAPFDDPAYSLPGSVPPSTTALQQRVAARRQTTPCNDGTPPHVLPSWASGGNSRRA